MHQTSSSAEPLQATLPQPEKTILCRNCGHQITHHRSAIEVGGNHEHTFRNPSGYSFHVLCFGDAPGCLKAGHPSQEATWFAGYTWSYALCSACHVHLGWCYCGPGEPAQFLGLIATRLLRK